MLYKCILDATDYYNKSSMVACCRQQLGSWNKLCIMWGWPGEQGNCSYEPSGLSPQEAFKTGVTVMVKWDCFIYRLLESGHD